jgi:hypothetical protein
MYALAIKRSKVMHACDSGGHYKLKTLVFTCIPRTIAASTRVSLLGG